jgi:TrmH family RNA methyltransferase
MHIGKNSPKLTELRKAIRHGTLTSEGLLPIEGPILIEEALRSGVEVVDVFTREGGHARHQASRAIYEVEPDAFKSLQDTEHSQGVIATVRLREFTLDDALRRSPALVLILCRLQDPGNVGTILRVSEAFGASSCIALRDTAGFYNGKVVRASAGSLFRLPSVGGIALHDIIQTLRSRHIAIVGSAPKASLPVDAWDWRKPTALLVGNEGGGLNDDELAVCDTTLRIPHQSTVESLNSAIATAVMLYEASKQRH